MFSEVPGVFLSQTSKAMISPQGISKKPPANPSLNFEKLREEGIKIIQNLSGGIWTDYNLHDPGVTTLEILCYALTDLGYKTEQLMEAFERDEKVDQDFINNYFFKIDEILPHLPLTKWDLENFIEKNHSKVLSAWFETYPIFNKSGLVKGGYEVALLLEYDEKYGNLNSDITKIELEGNEAFLEIIFFDENNHRIEWGKIQKINSCQWNEDDPDNFFVFEKFNCQVALNLEITYQNQRKTTTLPTKARVTFNPLREAKKKIPSIENHKEAIIQRLDSPEFLKVLGGTLSREYFKTQLLIDIKQTLLPYRNLCEDFIAFRVVNEQEIKIDTEVILDDFAPDANTVINEIYDRLDAFLLQIMLRAKQPGHGSEKTILYASNLIEEMVKAKGVAAASIRNLNLFIDGVPTIPLQDETAFECIHLQRFNQYVPKINREKSSIVFNRAGTKEVAEFDSISKAYKPQIHFLPDERIARELETERKKIPILSKSFFEELRQYHSIQNDFPQNYRLSENLLSDKTPETLKVRARQFKAYLVFFERIMIDYLEQLYGFHDLLSVKKSPAISENELQRLKNKLPDLEKLKLIDEDKWENTASSEQGRYQTLLRQHKIIDHLLARFAISYSPIMAGTSNAKTSEKALQDKMLLLRDIPIITKERGLGLPIKPEEKGVWDSDLLSGFQKRMYRLLGVNNNAFRHVKLTKMGGNEPVGFYLVEHILLVEREEDTIFSKKFNRAAELLFEYIINLYTGRKTHGLYSFQLSIVIPAWYRSWNRRYITVENAIRKELPAHIFPHFHWMNKKQMGEFEILYEDWLEALLQINNK
ncbi:hypothetical protein BH23BAC1_BH23BAC1_17790 [soil metagenome]